MQENEKKTPVGPRRVPSPCVSLCKMNGDTGLCDGCLRTIDEIIHWNEADDAYKHAVWAAIAVREAAIDVDF